MKRFHRRVYTLFCALPAAACASAGFAIGAEPGQVPPVLPTNPTNGAGNIVGIASLMSVREFWLTCIILVFGLTIILVEFFLLRRVVEQKTEEIARTYTVTLIIIGTLVLISSGYSNQQIAPALGLFGTIAGYPLGRSEAKKEQAGERSRDKGMSDG